MYMNTQHLAILGRQADLSLAELEQAFGRGTVRYFSPSVATVSAELDVQTLGGTTKTGVVIFTGKNLPWVELSKKIIQHYRSQWSDASGKRTIGISVYDWSVSPRDIQKTGLLLKSALKSRGVSVRLIPNVTPALSTATSHHNKLGLSDTKIELLISRSSSDNQIIVAESTGAQNITALARRDQGRPKRDAFVGMLPPKLALMMINLSGIRQNTKDHANLRILDPFCGTGVVLQEAWLQNYNIYGTDLSEKMVDYSQHNIEWLSGLFPKEQSITIEHGDAMTTTWQSPISAVVAETYLGQPFSAPPAADILDKVVKTVDAITTNFLKNIHDQIESGTPLCLAVPAWRSTTGWFTYLPVINKLESLGYEWQQLENVDTQKLTYYREDQVVARQLLLLMKT
jgi:tRNA G10  N-methylase Trm11